MSDSHGGCTFYTLALSADADTKAFASHLRSTVVLGQPLIKDSVTPNQALKTAIHYQQLLLAWIRTYRNILKYLPKWFFNSSCPTLFRFNLLWPSFLAGYVLLPSISSTRKGIL